MLVVFLSTLLFVAAGTSAQLHLGLSRWPVSGVLLLVAVLLHFLRVGLYARYARERAAALERLASAPAGDASTSPAPRWVTELSNVAFGALLAAVLPVVESLSP